MTISASDVKTLRNQTGAGMMDCKRALEETNGNLEKAVTLLREKGIMAASKKSSREAKEGIIHTYIHPGSRIATMVEINCETDFVARNESFQALAQDIAMQIAATRPIAVDREQIDEAILEQEKEIYRNQARNEGKPDQIIEKIIFNEYIPHNIDLGNDQLGILLYGLNAAGKSSLMKSVGVNIILAQIRQFGISLPML